MEITDINEAKALIDQNVKFFVNKEITKNLQDLPVIEGKLIKIIEINEHTKGNKKSISYSYHIDVTDPVDGGVHHIVADRIFSVDEKDDDVENIGINDKIATLQAEIAKMKAKK